MAVRAPSSDWAIRGAMPTATDRDKVAPVPVSRCRACSNSLNFSFSILVTSAASSTQRKRPFSYRR